MYHILWLRFVACMRQLPLSQCNQDGPVYYVRDFVVELCSCWSSVTKPMEIDHGAPQTYCNLSFQAFPCSCVYPFLSAQEASKAYLCEYVMRYNRTFTPANLKCSGVVYWTLESTSCTGVMDPWAPRRVWLVLDMGCQGTVRTGCSRSLLVPRCGVFLQ
jgi:hypothetical protein